MNPPARLSRLVAAGLMQTALMAACVGRAGADAPFDFGTVREMAAALADSPHVPPEKVPQDYLDLDYDTYRLIAPRNDTAMWRDTDSPTWVEFFSAGFLYPYGVKVFAVEEGKPRAIEYGPNWFQFRGQAAPLAKAPGEFAGLRLLSQLPGNEHKTEFLAFLGASYFRGIGSGQWYGTSARGLAIDIGLPKPEEFPRFTHLWVEKPESSESCQAGNESGQSADDRQRVWALMESPGVVGAYQFRIAPGEETSVCVEAYLWRRHGIQKLALAPLTSMWMWNSETMPVGETRPEVHDADGLLIHHGEDEWIWRDLERPETPRTQRWRTDRLRGFGLIQRERDPASYQDDEAKYHLRPSVWVDVGVRSAWGPGWVELLELPADHEGVDNIGAYFVIDQDQSSLGQGFGVRYELSFGMSDPRDHRVASVEDSSANATTGEVRVVYQASHADVLNACGDAVPMARCTGGAIDSVALDCKDDGRLVVTATYTPPPRGEGGEPAAAEPVIEVWLESDNRLVSEKWSHSWSPARGLPLLADSPVLAKSEATKVGASKPPAVIEEPSKETAEF